jgi:hypothetical protein
MTNCLNQNLVINVVLGLSYACCMMEANEDLLDTDAAREL